MRTIAMFMTGQSRRFLCRMLIALPIALALAGCETMDKLNPFQEKETPLPGARRPLFPEGVPGVDFGAPPPQPSNANIPIPSSIGQDETPPPQAQPSAQTARAPQPAQRPGTKSSQGTSDDAWAGTR
ncbi:MAG: hypothetical protein IT539_12680 [Bradyrhizobiaceae bacterium]|nr:hypothetical protein [Bradyrhizobiaceae bacterium]